MSKNVTTNVTTGAARRAAWLVAWLLAAAGLLGAAMAQAQTSAPGPRPAPDPALTPTSEITAVRAALVMTGGSLPLGRFAAHLEDATGTLTIDAVRAGLGGLRFAQPRDEHPNFGYSQSAHWLRFALDPGNAPLDMLLEIALPSLDSIDLYTPQGAGFSVQHAGDQVPWAERGFPHRNHVFSVRAPADAPAVFYLRVASASVVTVPLTLWSRTAFAAHERQAQLVYGLFYGLVVAMFLYNFGLLLVLRDPVYFHYVAYVASFGMALFVFDGFAFEHLWPANVWWANQALATAFAATMGFASQFSRSFLATAVHEPQLDRIAQGITWGAVLIAVCSATGFALQYSHAMQAISALAATGASLSLVIAVRGLARGYRPARFFLLAWGVLLVFIVLAALRNFALVPSNFLTMNGLHFGVAFDVLLLSFGLGDRINLLRREKLNAQAALLESTQRQERELAQRVDERTAQLEDANRQLRIEAQERDALVQKLAEDETRMRHLAQHDVLTGLPNRLSLQERFALATEYAKRNEHKIAVMLLDLDHFKELNDTRGHAAGDEALIALAGRLRTTVRGADTVARMGGDEFVVLASDLDNRTSVQSVLEKLSDVIGIPVTAGGGAWTLSASIGVAFYPDDGASLDALLKLADAAMYSDKAARKRRGVHVPVNTA